MFAGRFVQAGINREIAPRKKIIASPSGGQFICDVRSAAESTKPGPLAGLVLERLEKGCRFIVARASTPAGYGGGPPPL